MSSGGLGFNLSARPDRGFYNWVLKGLSHRAIEMLLGPARSVTYTDEAQQAGVPQAPYVIRGTGSVLVDSPSGLRRTKRLIRFDH